MSLKSWSGCRWKKISSDLLPQVVEEWGLMAPPSLTEWSRIHLLQRATACLSITTVQSLLHVLKIPGQPHKVSNVLVKEPQQVKRDTTSLNEEAEQHEFEAWPDFQNFRICRMNFRSEISSGASRRVEAMIWINESFILVGFNATLRRTKLRSPRRLLPI